MSFGLFLENGNNDVLIDNERVHPRLIHTAVVSAPPASTVWTVTLPTPTARPIFATGFTATGSFSITGAIHDGSVFTGMKGWAANATLTVRIYEV